MATTTQQTTDVAQALAALLSDVDGLRVYWYVADTVRPPAAVIGQPDIDFADSQAGFCQASWSFPVTVITSRTNERDAQIEMSRLLSQIVNALDTNVDGLFSIEPLDARPQSGVLVNGQELPAYQLNIRIRA